MKIGGSSYTIKKCSNLGGLEKLHIGSIEKIEYPYSAKQKRPNAAQDKPITIFEKTSENTEFISFRCEHRKPETIDAIWNDNEISLFFERSKFDLEYYPAKELAVFTTGKNTINDLLTRLNRNEKHRNFHFTSLFIDFNKLDTDKSTLDHYNAWFNVEGLYTNIKTEAVFGNKIGKDEEFRRLKKSGFLKSSLYAFNFQGTEIIVHLSQGASIWYPASLDPVLERKFITWLYQFTKPHDK